MVQRRNQVRSLSQISVSGGETLSESSGFQVRVLGLENYREAERLAHLLEEHYDEEVPSKEIFDPAFWCTSLEENLDRHQQVINLVIREDRELIAHLALNIRSCSQSVDLMFPAFHPDYQERCVELGKVLWAQIRHLAERQGWQHFFLLGYHAQDTWQLLARECFNTHIAAILPIAGSDQGGRSSIENRLGSERYVLISYQQMPRGDEPAICLYPPDSQTEKIAALYRRLELKRSFAKPSGLQKRTVSTPHPRLRDGVLNVEDNFRNPFMERVGVRHLAIMPGGLPNAQRTIERIEDRSRRLQERSGRLTVHVALSDPGCPSFCDSLEALGYRFCGVLPQLHEHDFAAYSRMENSAVDEIPLDTKLAAAL